LISVLDVKNITKHYSGPAGSKETIFENLSFSVGEEHNITSILAPFGGGKSTLLKILSGLDNDYTGELLLYGNKLINKLPLIPEKPASFPWLNVEGNIKLINSIPGNNKKLSQNEIQDLIDLTGLTSYEGHFPNNKSYGFRFRIALARTLVVSPPIVFLDDPFKQMDSETKDEIFELLTKIASIKKIKFLFASSNISEAALLADKILLLNGKPGYFSGEIVNDKFKKRVEFLKDEIREILLKENVVNTTNFSI